MRCEDAIEQIAAAGSRSDGDLKAAMGHAAECADCRAALRALDALRPLRDEPTPAPSERARERAIDSPM
jgi:bacterioferritin-associated ferredoxin